MLYRNFYSLAVTGV